MKELTIEYKGKKYTTTDEKQIEVYEMVVTVGYQCLSKLCQSGNCPFAGSVCGLYELCEINGGVTHSLKTISEYPLNFMELTPDKIYEKQGRDIKYSVVDGKLCHAGDETHGVPIVNQSDRFKEYVSKMVSKTVERFVSDVRIKDILETTNMSESSVYKNKITITFEVEE